MKGGKGFSDKQKQALEIGVAVEVAVQAVCDGYYLYKFGKKKWTQTTKLKLPIFCKHAQGS